MHCNALVSALQQLFSHKYTYILSLLSLPPTPLGCHRAELSVLQSNCPLAIFLHTIMYISSVQSFSHVRLFVTPRTAACQASLSITNSWSLLKLMSIESVMPSNHLILCHSLLLLPSIFPSIRIFSNESLLHIR